MSASQANRRITALAADRAVHRAFGWLHLHEPRLRRWQMQFLAIPAPPFGEAARAAWFVERFRELGLHNPHLDDAGNALAELRTASESFAEGDDHRGGDTQIPCGNDKQRHTLPCVLLSAHLDTVFPPGTECAPREDGPRILGPGATDNGAGLTALLALAAALRHAELAPPVTVLFAANVGEEGPGDLRGMRHLFSPGSAYEQRIRAAVALEGSGEATVVDRALGSRRLRVTVTGPGGHSWADAGRPNPIFGLSAALAAVARLKHPANPRTTLNCGLIRGGTSVNSIPETASADLDLRSVSALELDRTELAVLRTLESALPGAAGGLAMRVERIGDRPSGELAPTEPLAVSLRAVDRHLSLTTDARIGSTDANIPLALKIPALAIGCGGTGWGIHTLQEGYDPTGREIALRRILLLLLDACQLVRDAGQPEQDAGQPEQDACGPARDDA